MSRIDESTASEIRENYPDVPSAYLDENKTLKVEDECKETFLASRAGKLGVLGKIYHNFVEAPAGDIVSIYVLAIDSEDEHKADVLLRFYTAPENRALLLYRDTVAVVSEAMPKPGDEITVRSSRNLSKDIMLSHRFVIG